MTNTRTGSAVGWLALLVGIIALVVAIVAINPSDFEDAETREAADNFLEEAEMVEETALQVTARLKAKADVMALRAELVADGDYVAAEERLEEIEDELGRAYRGAAGEVRDTWREFAEGIQAIENALEDESQQALALMEALAEKLDPTMSGEEEMDEEMDQ